MTPPASVIAFLAFVIIYSGTSWLYDTMMGLSGAMAIARPKRRALRKARMKKRMMVVTMFALMVDLMCAWIRVVDFVNVVPNLNVVK